MLFILLLVLILVAYNIESATTIAQVQESSAPQSNAQSDEQSQKKVKNLIPSHIPIKVKIKHLEITKKMREIEIEVTNTAAKPIYYINQWLFLTGERSDNNAYIAMQFRYGRVELSDFQTEVTSEDVPLNPGETIVLKMLDDQAEWWEEFRVRRNRPNPFDFELKFSRLVFGDHTGFAGFQGIPLPRNQNSNDQSIFSPIGMKTRQSCNKNLLTEFFTKPPDSETSTQVSFLPASFMPVNFSLEERSNSVVKGNTELFGNFTPQPSSPNPN